MKALVKNIDGQAVTGFIVVFGLTFSVLGIIAFSVASLA